MDKQKQILQALWRRAGRMSEPLEINCKTESDAKRTRFALYNAVREFKEKDGKPGKPADDELKYAIENCSVGYKEGSVNVLVIRGKASLEMMGAVLEALGDEKLLDEEQITASASAALVMKKLAAMEKEDVQPAQPIPGTRVTPYYTR